MRQWITTIEVNALIAIIILGGLQGWILYELNGKLGEILTSGCIEQVVVVFAPVLAIGYVARKWAGVRPEHKHLED